MTDETLADKRRRQADAAEQYGDLGTAWTFREDANALDAKNARIAELERESTGWRQACEAYLRQSYTVEERAEAAEAECERLRAALQEIECDSYGRVARIARTALTTDHQGDDNTTA